MRTVFLIAANVVRENIRRRTMYVAILFAFLLLGVIESLSRFEAELQIKMVKDFSYTLIALFGLVMTLLISFDQLPQEMESRTLYLMLARPLSRKTYLLGKFFGIMATITGLLAVMGVILVALTAFVAPGQKIPLDLQLVQGLFLLDLKYAIFASLLLLFTLIASRPIAISLACLIYAFGHVSEAAHTAISSSTLPVVPHLFGALRLVLPNFQFFDFGERIMAQELYSLQAMSLMFGYAATFVFLYLLLSFWAFASKDL